MGIIKYSQVPIKYAQWAPIYIYIYIYIQTRKDSQRKEIKKNCRTMQ
jgi:hypothetical protein